MEVHPVIIHFCWGDFRIVYENDEKHRIGFVLFFLRRVLGLVLAFFPGTICLVFATELEPVISHGICYILVWSLCIWHGIATCGNVRLPFCMVFARVLHVDLSFAWYLLYFGTSNVDVGFLRVL